MKPLSSPRAVAGALILVLAAACQSDSAVTPTMVAGGDVANGLSSIPVGSVCNQLIKGVSCLADGTVITNTPSGFNVTGARGTYSLDITASSVRMNAVGDPLRPSRMVITATGARFTVSSMTQSEVINYVYSSGDARDLTFTVSAASGQKNLLSIMPPKGRFPFTLGPGGTQFGGDEWDLKSDFGGEEWGIRVQDGVMSITGLDDWESPITAEDDWMEIRGTKALVGFQFNSGNMTAVSGLVNVQSTQPFAALIRLGSRTLSAYSTCGVKLCDPGAKANIDFLLTEVGFPAILTIPSTSFRQLRER